MYEKLLISAGGGIISREQQSEQSKDSVTIAIGLGGTGISCLRALKKEVYTRIKPDGDSSLNSEYKHIKFLAIDTDKSSIGDKDIFGAINANTEFLNISCPDVGALLENGSISQVPYLQWLKVAQNTSYNGNGITIMSVNASPGAVKQIGRLLFMINCNAFVAKLTNMINEACEGLRDRPRVNIHILTGLCGGTGAGIFLDVCYIVRYVLSEINLAGSVFTNGYFFMPDVNIANGNASDYVPINGFASMKELDYCMNFHNNGDKWDQQYDGFKITTKKQPVDIAYLITATDYNGSIKRNAYDYSMATVANYITESIINYYSHYDEDFVYIPNIFYPPKINMFSSIVDKKHGTCYNYCVLGSANAYLPYKEITTYLTSKIFEGFASLDKQLPFDNDIEAFVQKCGVRYEDIVRSLNDKVPNIPNFAVDTKELYEQVKDITFDTTPQILAKMRDKLPAVNGKYTENKLALLDNSETPLMDSTKQIVSLYAKVKKELLQIAVQPDKGPYYAGGILHNLKAKDLISIICGYVKRNSEILAHAKADLSLRKQSVAITLLSLQSSNFLNRKRRAEEYSLAIHSYYVQLAKIDLYETMGDLLTEFSKQLTEMYDGFFGIFANVMNTLQVTFENNLSTLTESVTEDNSYAMKLVSIQDLQESLDLSVKAMRIEYLIHGFVSEMLNNPDSWILQDQNKIANVVTKYFLSQLNTYTNKTIIDYLRIKFGVTAPETLQKKIYNEILLPLVHRASPLFWTDSSVYSLDDAYAMGYLSVPTISYEIQTAAQDYKMLHSEFNVFLTRSQDRITILNLCCGVPMFGYKGVSNYMNIYNILFQMMNWFNILTLDMMML